MGPWMEWGKQDGLGSCSVSPQSHSKGHLCSAVGMGEGNREIVLVNLAPGKDNVYNHLWLWCIHESDRDEALVIRNYQCLNLVVCVLPLLHLIPTCRVLTGYPKLAWSLQGWLWSKKSTRLWHFKWPSRHNKWGWSGCHCFSKAWFPNMPLQEHWGSLALVLRKFWVEGSKASSNSTAEFVNEHKNALNGSCWMVWQHSSKVPWIISLWFLAASKCWTS